MKRLLSGLLVCCLLLSVLAMPTHAASVPQTDADPVVFLLGFSTANLYYWDGESDAREMVWNLTADGVMDLAKQYWPQALRGLLEAVFLHRYDTLNDAAGKIAAPVLEKMEKLTMLPDGTQKYDLSLYYGLEPELPLWYCKSYRNVYLTAIYRALMAQYGRVYVFVSDWRRGQIEQARDLDAFIQQVKADSGKQQVTLFGFSQGGQTIGTYLYYYGDKGDVKKAVMETPAIGGTEFASSILDPEDFRLNVETMIAFAESYMWSEAHYEFLGKFLRLRWLEKPILSIAYTHVLPIAMYWGGLWDLVPAAKYDKLKEKYLDPIASAKLIEGSDAYHYDVIPHIGQKLRDLQKKGMSISIVCNSGNLLLFNRTQGDGILSTANVSGAAVAGYGKRFGADTHIGTVCTDPTHRHLSPSMTVDASSCYLPENTWFVDGQFHGQCDWDPYSYSLLCRLLMTDDLTDVYADPAYPQFVFAQSPSDRFAMDFASGGSYVKGNTLTLKNVSQEHVVRLQSVTIRGTQLRVSVPAGTELQPGESVTLSVTGKAPADGTFAPVSVLYTYADDQVPIPRMKTWNTSVPIA